MRVLIVKMSSLGDVVHTLPALTDAAKAVAGVQFDWVVEEAFAEIPAWHPAVNNVIPVAIRRWRRSLVKATLSGELNSFRRRLRAVTYDKIIDAQGLIKSAMVTGLAKGEKYGLSGDAAREPLAALGYQHKFSIPKEMHAVARLRLLFAQALEYSAPASAIDYGVKREQLKKAVPQRYVVFVHGTTWHSKQWPENKWMALGKIANEHGFLVYLPWGNEEERQRAERLAKQMSALVLPRLNLTGMAEILVNAQAVVGVDTGLAHVAAAWGVPAFTIYGATKAALTGTVGYDQQHVIMDYACAPCLRKTCRFNDNRCYDSVSPQQLWQRLQATLNQGSSNNAL